MADERSLRYKKQMKKGGDFKKKSQRIGQKPSEKLIIYYKDN